jgi:hypothetical protein
MCSNAKTRTRLGRTEKDEAGFAIFRKIADCVAGIEVARPHKLTGAR